MGSETPLRIPTIDFSNVGLEPAGSPAWVAVRAQVWAALDRYGCFEALCGGVTPELRGATLAAAKELFALPLEAKLHNVTEKAYHGYIGQIPELPSYESLAVEDVLSPGVARSFTDLMWPTGNPSFCETICEFAEKAAALDRILRRMVLESMGVDGHCDSHMGSTKYSLRLSEYAPPPAAGSDDGAKLALNAHVDSNVCTLIYQLNYVDGLEVRVAGSGDWIPVLPSSPGSFVFVTGDVFRAWSNDRLKSKPHRVRMNSGETSRYTAMLFVLPKDEVVIEAPEELVDEGHPRRFQPFVYVDYMKFFASASRRAAEGDPTSILTEFCGTTGMLKQDR